MSKQTASLSKVNEKGNHTLAKKRKLSGPGVSKSSQSPVHSILHLQRTKGNQEVQRLLKSGTLQAKLKIGQPNDKYEQEADRVADKVMSMPEPSVQRQPEEEKEEIQTKPLAGQITPLVQRQVGPGEEEEPLQKKLLQRQETGEEEEIQTKLQRQAEEEEEPVQTKQSSNQTPAGTSNIESSVNWLKGGGQPLSESTRSYFEPRFGADFSQVRIHTESKAAETAASVNAKAFTTGKDVVFGTGQYSPGTSSGKRLLAHELTHTVQQGSTLPKLIQRKILIGGKPVEWEKTELYSEANRLLWKKFPELKKRQLTLSKEDDRYRRIWWIYVKKLESQLPKFLEKKYQKYGTFGKELLEKMHNAGNPPTYQFDDFSHLEKEIIKNSSIESSNIPFSKKGPLFKEALQLDPSPLHIPPFLETDPLISRFDSMDHDSYMILLLLPPLSPQPDINTLLEPFVTRGIPVSDREFEMILKNRDSAFNFYSNVLKLDRKIAAQLADISTSYAYNKQLSLEYPNKTEQMENEGLLPKSTTIINIDVLGVFR